MWLLFSSLLCPCCAAAATYDRKIIKQVSSFLTLRKTFMLAKRVSFPQRSLPELFHPPRSGGKSLWRLDLKFRNSKQQSVLVRLPLCSAGSPVEKKYQVSKTVKIVEYKN